MSSSPDSSPSVLPRPVRDQFVSVLCSFCRKGSTSYRCQVLLDNGDFVLNGERVCGRPFCSDCAEEAGIDGNRTQCPRHLFGDVIDSGVINPPLMSRVSRSSSSSASGVDAAPVNDSNQSVGQSNPAVPSGDASNGETAGCDFRNTRSGVPNGRPSPQQANGRVRSEDDPCLNSQHVANSDPAMSPQNPEWNTNNDASVPTSSSQPSSFNDFEVYAIGQIYEREAFVNEVKCAAHKSRFEVAIRGPRILCSRACRGSDRPKAAAKKAATPVEKKRKKSSHTVGCSWVIRWVLSFTLPYPYRGITGDSGVPVVAAGILFFSRFFLPSFPPSFFYLFFFCLPSYNIHMNILYANNTQNFTTSHFHLPATATKPPALPDPSQPQKGIFCKYLVLLNTQSVNNLKSHWHLWTEQAPPPPPPSTAASLPTSATHLTSHVHTQP